MRVLILSTLMLATVAAAVPADAGALRERDDDREERRQIQKAELERARALGGYGNPLTAFLDLIAGRDVGNAIQPVITEPPKPRARVNGIAPSDRN